MYIIILLWSYWSYFINFLQYITKLQYDRVSIFLKLKLIANYKSINFIYLFFSILTVQ